MTMVKKTTKKEPQQPKVPYSYKPDNMKLEDWQIALRRQFALEQNFGVENIGTHPVFSDFNVHNSQTKRTYKVAIRDEKNGLNFCSCPDFKVSVLGTCKHIEYTLHLLKSKRTNKKYFKNIFILLFFTVNLFADMASENIYY